MNDYKLELSNNLIYLKIINTKYSGCALTLIAGIAIFMFLFPIVIILFILKELSFGILVSSSLAWFISAFFIKLYLWNKYGEEIFIIKNNELEIYNNYKFFKGNYRHYQFNELEVVFISRSEVFFANEESEYIDVTQLSSIGFQLDNKQVIVSHKELTISKIKEIALQMKNRL